MCLCVCVNGRRPPPGIWPASARLQSPVWREPERRWAGGRRCSLWAQRLARRTRRKGAPGKRMVFVRLICSTRTSERERERCCFRVYTGFVYWHITRELRSRDGAEVLGKTGQRKKTLFFLFVQGGFIYVWVDTRKRKRNRKKNVHVRLIPNSRRHMLWLPALSVLDPLLCAYCYSQLEGTVVEARPSIHTTIMRLKSSVLSRPQPIRSAYLPRSNLKLSENVLCV